MVVLWKKHPSRGQFQAEPGRDRKNREGDSQYGVFDHIYFAIKGTDTVVLKGQASRPTLKSSAENVVKKIQGVKTVDNQIQVLPVSPNDDRIRAAVYASIYGFPALQKYTSNRGGPEGGSIARTAGGITNDPPTGFHAIHIIVENGNVTLTGVVDNDSDLAMAEMRANVVPGVFSVDNDLQVDETTLYTGGVNIRPCRDDFLLRGSWRRPHWSKFFTKRIQKLTVKLRVYS